MAEIHNYLKAYRKQSPLSQRDVAVLLDAPDCTHLCRCEQGERNPPLEMLLVYNLLFDVKVERLVARQREALKEDLLARIKTLGVRLNESSQTEKVEKRVMYLRSVFKRLMNEKNI